MKVCPNCNHHIYDESLTICPYCIEKLPTEEESEEDELIEELYETTHSENDEVTKYLKTVTVIDALSYFILIIPLICLFGALIVIVSGRPLDPVGLSVGVGGFAAFFGIKHYIARMRMIANMAQDMHTTASVNLLMLKYKIDEINKNQARLTEAEKQEFLSEQTISEIRDEIDGIETQYEIASFEQDLSSKEEKTQTEERRYMKEVERRYTARIKQASDRIIPLENEIMGFYEQFLQIVDARKNPIEPAPSGRRRRQS